MKKGGFPVEDAYLVVDTVTGWIAYRAYRPGWRTAPDDLEFGSEEEMKLSLSAMGYEYASGDGICEAQVWRRQTAKGRA